MKSFSILLILLVSLFSAHAVNINFNQANVLSEYSIAELGTTYEFILIGASNTKSIGNQTGDLKFEYKGVDNNMYILIDNPTINNSVNITYVNDNPKSENTTTISITQELIFNEVGIYYIQFIPTFDNENFDVMINAPDSATFSVFSQQEVPKGFNGAMLGFVNAFTDIFEINIAVWRIMYYVFIASIILVFVLILFGLAFTLFRYAKRLKSEKFRSNHEDN